MVEDKNDKAAKDSGPVIPGAGGQVAFEVPRGEGNEAEAAKAPAVQSADEAFPPAQ